MFVWRTNCSSLNCNTRHIKHVCKENTHTCIRTHHPRHACNTHRITITEERHLRESLINVLRLVKLYWQPLWHNLNHMETHTLDDLTRSEPQDIELAHAASKSTIKVVHLLCPLYYKSSGTSRCNTLFHGFIEDFENWDNSDGWIILYFFIPFLIQRPENI